MVHIHADEIAKWLVPSKTLSETRTLRVMAINPENEGLVSATIGLMRASYDTEKFADEIHKTFYELDKEVEMRINALPENERSNARGRMIFEKKVYNTIPACSIVATDPTHPFVQVFAEFYGYGIPWEDRLCVEMANVGDGKGLVSKAYIKAFAELWNSQYAETYEGRKSQG